MEYKIPKFCIMVMLLVSGCARTLQVTYICYPVGATIHQSDGANFGICPTAVKYNISQQDRRNGYMTLKGITAKWISGASASVPSIHADLKLGTTQSYNLVRPADAPGYDMDKDYAEKVEELMKQATAKAQAEQGEKSNLLMQGLAQGAVMAVGARYGGTAGLKAESAYFRGQNQ